MNLVVDIGNTTVKAAVFAGNEMVDYKREDGQGISIVKDLAEKYDIDKCIISSTVNIEESKKQELNNLGCEVEYLNSQTPLPIRNLYRTPETLGTDRLAGVVGAYDAMPGKDILVIDMGTAITYDIINAKGEYLGGNISPGITMRLKALHNQTAKLPLVEADGDKPEIGYDTDTAIRCGVTNGVKYEIEGFISAQIVKYPYLLIFLTGGDGFDFDECIKKRIFVDRFLVLKGLNRILNH